MEKTKEKQLLKIKRNNCLCKSKRRKMIKYLQPELRSCTTHGLCYLLNTELHYLERLFWVINSVAALVLMSFLLWVQYTRYTHTPIVMSVEKDYFNWNVSYPAITLCPQNRNKTDKQALKMLAEELQNRTTVDQLTIEEFLESIGSISLEYLQEEDFEKLASLQVLDPKEYASFAARVFKRIDPLSITTTTNWPISVDAAITEMGMCHVINSNVAIFDDPLQWNNNITTYSKNNVELAFHDRDFFAQITKYSDIYKIFIHAPDDVVVMPTSSHTYDIQWLLSLGVKVWSFKTSDDLRDANLKIRKCRYIHEATSERYPLYSYTHCLRECRINMIKKLCGCIPHFYRPLESEIICSISMLKCINKFKKHILSLSSPSTVNARLDLPTSHHSCGCVNLCDANVYQKEQENILPSTVQTMRVVISSFPRVRVVRETIFNLYDILLRSGGVVNLCFGTSIISLGELVIIILRILVFMVINK